MRKRWIRFGCVACALVGFALSGTAFAQEPRYSFVEAGWVRFDPDGGDTENGWFAGGSVGLKRFHFFAEYQDPGPFERWDLGGGWHGLLGDRADLVAEAAYIDTDSDNGYRIDAGIRWFVTERLELGGFYNRDDIDDYEDNAFRVHGLWAFSKAFSVGASLQFGDEADTWRAFARLYWGKR